MDSEYEEWRSIPGLEGRYDASTSGRIRGWRTLRGEGLTEPTIRSAYFNRSSGYLFVGICVNGKKRTRSVHSLVCEAFHGPPPHGFVVNHVDGIKTNNRADNLEWVTRSENNLHASRNGLMARGSHKPNAKLTEEQVAAIRTEYSAGGVTVRALADRYGVSFGTMREAIRSSRGGWPGVPGAVAIDRDRCRNGHLKTPENTYIAPRTGARMCRTCQTRWGRTHKRARHPSHSSAV